MGLTAKQKIFCDKYLECKNATEAAIFAGYSEKTAKSIGQENLTKPDISDYIEEKLNRTSEKLDISRERVLAEYAKIAFADIGEAFDSDGSLLPLDDMNPSVRGAIAGIETVEEKEKAGLETIVTGVIRKVKFWDKKAALDSICKVMGYNSAEKVTVEGLIVVKRPKADE